MVFASKILPYRVFEKSWTTAPTNLAMGIGGMANMLKIVTGPSDIAVRLNSTDNDLIEYVDDLNGVAPFSEIYITSAQVAGSCKIYVSWEGQ